MFDQHKDRSGMWLPAKAAESVRFECFHCGHPHIDTTRTKSEWNRTGEYVADNPTAARDHVSVVWPGFIDYQWDFLIAKFVDAMNRFKRRDPSDLIAFLQKYGPEPANEGRLFEDEDPFHRVVINTETESEYCVRIMTADVQQRGLLWVLVCEWTLDGRCRRRWFGKCYSFAELDEKRAEHNVPKHHVLIDSRYNGMGPAGVFAASLRYGWIPVQGDAGEQGQRITYRHDMVKVVLGKPERYTVLKSYSDTDPKSCIKVDPDAGQAAVGSRKLAMLVRFCATTMKDRSEEMVESKFWTEDPDANTEMDKEFRKQFNAEYRKPKTTGSGKVIYVWTKRSPDNHGRDLAAYQCLGATIKGLIPDEN